MTDAAPLITWMAHQAGSSPILALMPQGAVLDVQHGVDNLLEAVRKLNAEDKALAGDLLRVLVGLPRHLLSDIQAYELDLWTAKIFAQCASEPPQYDTDGLMAAQAYDPAVAVLTVDAIRQTMTAQGYPAPLPMVEWHLETLAADTSEWQPVASEPACVGTTANWPLPQPGWYRAVATLKPYGQPPVVLGISQPVHIDAA